MKKIFQFLNILLTLIVVFTFASCRKDHSCPTGKHYDRTFRQCVNDPDPATFSGYDDSDTPSGNNGGGNGTGTGTTVTLVYIASSAGTSIIYDQYGTEQTVYHVTCQVVIPTCNYNGNYQICTWVNPIPPDGKVTVACEYSTYHKIRSLDGSDGHKFYEMDVYFNQGVASADATNQIVYLN